MAAPLPNPNDFVKLVGMLVGQQPRVGKGTPLTAIKGNSIATYVNASKSIVYAAIVDTPFVVSAGAALAMIPPGVANDCIKSGKPTDGMAENAYEVLNVSASLFNDIPGTSLHVKLDKLQPAVSAPAELTSKLARPLARVDMLVTIPGYPDSKVSLLSLA
jgi:hypothetical protein